MNLIEISFRWLCYSKTLKMTNFRTEPMASFGDFGTGKFSMSHERHITIPVQVTIFPHEWLSRRGEKKNPPRAAKPRVEDFFLPQLLSHSYGKIVTRTGIVMCLE